MMHTMSILVICLLLLTSVSCSSQTVSGDEAYSLVRPIIGTSFTKLGNVVPAASVPFGKTMLVPETRKGNVKCKAPYYYEDEFFRGVRLSHWISGSCTQDYGSFTFSPFILEPNSNNCGHRRAREKQEVPLDRQGDIIQKCHDFNVSETSFSKIDHTQERSEPALYSLSGLFGGRLDVNFTAAVHSSIINFTPKRNNFMLQLSHTSRSVDGNFSISLETGVFVFKGQNQVRKLYDGNGARAGFSGHLYAVISTLPTEYGFLVNNIKQRCTSMACSAKGTANETVVPYAVFKDVQVITVRAAVSFVSMDGAQNNLDVEIGKQKSFNDLVASSRKQWVDEFSRVLVSKENKDNVIVFYTSLYRSLILPRQVSDVDGRYQGIANTGVQTDGPHYDDFSAWDTFRAFHPLHTILNPRRSLDFVKSLIRKAELGGWLPIYPAWASYTDEMIGDSLTAIIGDAILKNIVTSTEDLVKAYYYMRQNANGVPSEEEYNAGKGRRCGAEYRMYHYVPVECLDTVLRRAQQSSRTVEYSLQDSVLAAVAEKLFKKFGNATYKADAIEFRKRSMYFQNVMDKDFGFINGRHQNGSFVKMRNPKQKAYYLTEGTPWQWTFSPMHNILGLLPALNITKDKLITMLDQFFDEGLDDHGNEPGHHAPFLYNIVGVPWKTQKTVSEIVAACYTNAPDGLSGNDDAGQMSAWLVLSALGLYQVSVDTPRFQLTTPMFKLAKINLENGRTFQIVGSGKESEEYIYTETATLNDNCIATSTIAFDNIIQGGVLMFQCAKTPPAVAPFEPLSCMKMNLDSAI